MYDHPPPSNSNEVPYRGIRNFVSGIAAVCVFAYLFYFGIDTYGYPWAMGIGWLRSLIGAVLAFGVIWLLLWLGALALARKSGT